MSDTIPLGGDEEELRDLSSEDAQELRNFQEKRRWFEAKLKLLEELSPTYPFILPSLVASEEDPAVYAYAGEDASSYHLPSTQTLRSWQVERDALEEEVFAFDGGDLGRMKEKTREVTLVPLTKPSTHAVAITLDLILLIDRLLTLLRKRYDLLELVSLRLQWDNLRWKVMLECGQLKADVKAFVDTNGKCDNSAKTESNQLPGSANLENHLSSEKKPTSTSSSSHSASPLITPDRPRHSTSSTPASSPTNLFSPHALSSLKPQSFTSAMSIRHRKLVSTHLKRSSAVLDKMIDIAGPLKDLGGLHGPLSSFTEEKEGGALPEELLDVQEELETQCDDIKARIKWCVELEEQRDFAARYLTSSTYSCQKAEQIIAQLKASLSQPATSAQHKSLALMLREVETSIPYSIERTLPRPKHPDYPNVDENTAQILSDIRTGENKVKGQYQETMDGVGWYARLLIARTQMEKEDRQLSSIIQDLPGQVDQLSLDDGQHILTGMASYEEWLNTTPGRISDLVDILPKITRQAQLGEITTIKYKSAYRPPSSLRQMLGEVPYPDKVHEETAARVEAALGLVRTAEDTIQKAKEDSQIVPLMMKVEKGVSHLLAEINGLKEQVEKQIEASIWTVDHSTSAEKGRSRDEIGDLREETRRCEVLYGTTLEQSAQLVSMKKKFGRVVERNPSRQAELEEGWQDLKSRMDLLERLSVQCQVVHDVDREAEELLKRLGRISGSEGKLSDGDDQVPATIPDLRELEKEIKDWVGGLADRVPFVSSESRKSSLKDYKSDAHSPSPPFRPLLEPVDGQKVINGSPSDLASVDERVRVHINNLSSHVSTSLEAAIHQYDEKAASRTSPSGTLAKDNKSTPDLSQVASSGEHDVFGSREPPLRLSTSGLSLRKPANPTQELSPPLSQLRVLRKQVKVLCLQDLVFPSGSTLLRTPALQRLPTVDTVNSVVQTLCDVEESIGMLKRDRDIAAGEGVHGAGSLEPELKKLQDELGSARAFIPRLEALAAFSDRAKACDEVFGNLMNLLDSKGEVVVDGDLEAEMAKGQIVLKDAEDSAMAVETDRRVLSDLKRIRAVWSDLSASLHPSHHNGINPHDDSASISSSTSDNLTQSSFPSPYVSRIPIPVSKPRLTSSMSVRSNLSLNASGMRTTSNPVPRLAATTESYRNRTVSTSEEGQRRRVESTSTRTGLTGSSSRSNLRVVNGSSTPLVRDLVNAEGMAASPSRIPRLANMSPAPGLSRRLNDHDEISRTRKTSMPTRFPSSASKPKAPTTARRVSDEKIYQSDPKSTLDQAVGKIFNKLKMSVPIVPVNIAGTDEWKDQSGRYWIGAHGRAKLCFCRILRSRTVMVRVGGGWMELSRFLMDHFADALWPITIEEAGGSAPTSVPATPQKNGRPSSSLLSTGDTTRNEPPCAALPHGSSVDYEPAVASLSDSKTPTPSAHLALSPQDDLSPITPIRQSHIPRSVSGSTSIPRSSQMPRSSSINRSSSFYSPLHTPMTPNQSVEGSGSGPSSPLVPLHFLKKASESPPVREKEKQRIGLGRRSILGKEGG